MGCLAAVVPHSVENVWEIRVNGVKNCNLLYRYFDNYKLKTNKFQSYLKWKAIRIRLEKGDHLNESTINELHSMSRHINKDVIDRSTYKS